MADIVDLSLATSSKVKVIDFRVFASLWCGINMDNTCFSSLCCAISHIARPSSDSNQCRSLLSGLHGNIDQCIHTVEEDCRTTVWTYGQNNAEMLDTFQPDKELKKKKKISYVRKRRDVYKALGPGSKAEAAAVLAFGTLFSTPYKGSESYIDIHNAPRDSKIQSLIDKIEFLPFSPEIINAGKEFSATKIKEPFLCAQLRLLDGQFKNHWKSTFSSLKEKIRSLQLDSKSNKKPIHIFIMTDLPTANWTGTYLEELSKYTEFYKLYTLQEGDDFIIRAAKKLMEAEHGMRAGFLPENLDSTVRSEACEPVRLPDVLLYIEEAVCSCASLGFVGTAGSTIADSIETMIKNGTCKL